MHDDTTDIDDRPFLRTVRVELRADGFNYVQPGSTTDTLLAIVALVNTLPGGAKPSVDLGSRTIEGYKFVLGLPGAIVGATPSVDEPDQQIVYAVAEVAGLEFRARYTQERTP